MFFYLFFFFQAEDGIRDHCVTGVQTCALPISINCLLTGSPPECPQFIAGKTRDEPEKWGTPLTFAPLAFPAECSRSEERRVGKECISRWSPQRQKKKKELLVECIAVEQLYYQT